ncbi:AI-2E family transporter [bacterium LRH843]|nr:AI-2E family transporter [bacterium LRH843]
MLKNNKFIQYLLFFFIALLLYKAVTNLDAVRGMLSNISALLSPFVIAFSIAFVLKSLINWMEKKFHMNRMTSIAISYTFLLGISIVMITVFTPKIIDSLSQLILFLPLYIEQTNTWLTQHVLMSPLFERFNITEFIDSNMQELMDQTRHYGNLLLNKFAIGLVSFTSSLLKFLLGVVISIYMLFDKERFADLFSRIIRAFSREERATKILNFFREIDVTFSKYIVGKIIDSIVFGLLSYIVLLLLNTPYTLLNAVILGVTNLIPYFGAIIGSIPAIVITLFVSPIQALWVSLAILALQQFHGIYLGPKIIGKSVNLSPFWVFTSIIIGGGAFGALGMFLAIPVFSIAKTMIDAVIEHRLEEKKANTAK